MTLTIHEEEDHFIQDTTSSRSKLWTMTESLYMNVRNKNKATASQS